MYRIPQLSKYPKLFHVISDKGDGNMANAINGVIYDFDIVRKNRERFLRKVGVDIDKTTCMWVTHSDDIIEAPVEKLGISMKDYEHAVKVDGLITNKKGIYLFLLVADCLPIIIYDPVKEVVALVHAGWKGVDLEIAKKAVEKFRLLYKSDPKDLVVGIGPCVYKESFIKENPSQKDDTRWQNYLEEIEDNKYKVDLVGFTKQQLVDSEVAHENIFESGIDTAVDERFFSHVWEGNLPISQQGRFACVVGIT